MTKLIPGLQLAAGSGPGGQLGQVKSTHPSVLLSLVWPYNPGDFQQWSFLHYDGTRDVPLYCQICVNSCKERKTRSTSAEPSFVNFSFHIPGSMQLLQLQIKFC